jgi:flagellar protein FliO/FliZ
METFYNTMSVPAKFILVFIVVAVVFGIGGYLWRRMTRVSLASGSRGRQPRLAVLDAASVDGRRQLVLIRRDNVEHLLLIGGPTDIVVEPNIDKAGVAAAAAMPASPALREIKASPALEPLSRPSPTYEPAPPISREPMPRETMTRETITREPIHRPAATYESARPSPAYEPALRATPALEETQWPAPEPVAVAHAEPLRTSWPVPEPVAVEPVAVEPIEASRASWPAPEPAVPVAVEPVPVEPTWPAPEPVAAAPVEPPHVSPHVSWPAPEPAAPPPVEAPRPREAAAWPFEEDAVAPPLMPPVEPEPVIPPPPPRPAFEPVFPMSEGRRMPAAPPLPPRNAQDEASNLTEMAQRLEAALRRPIRPVERTGAPVPHVAIEVPPPEPVPPPAPPPLPEVSVVPQPIAAPEPIAPPPAPAPPTAPGPRPAPVFTSIEDEMASLLGRSPGRP